MNRKQIIKEITDHILTLHLAHPIRVGVSGITASGKTIFANELAEKMFLNRYYVACKMYIDEHHPKECANVVFQKSDLENPEVIFHERE
ncbi:hypothetical protein [Bacillus cereus]|uniref:hypothetical protein n=1 Tax=Bacillus cereus TaxID=1396 RepID=UPI000BF69461|nr:hypothetical protein [Bacillus cereus]PEX83861.1 hypothetical protein CN450_19625 [Bacillus cereus]